MRMQIFGWLLGVLFIGSCNHAVKVPTIIEESGGYLSTEYYKDGSIHSQKRFVKGENDSMIAHGVSTIYYSDGNIMSTQYYHLGSLVGQVDSFYENGKLKSSSLYNQRNELVGQVVHDTNNNLLNFYQDPFHVLRDKGKYGVGDSLRVIYEVLNVQNLSPVLNITILKENVKQSAIAIDDFDTINNTLYGYYGFVFHSSGQYIHIIEFDTYGKDSAIYSRRLLDTIDVSK